MLRTRRACCFAGSEVQVLRTVDEPFLAHRIGVTRSPQALTGGLVLRTRRARILLALQRGGVHVLQTAHQPRRPQVRGHGDDQPDRRIDSVVEPAVYRSQG